MTPPFFMEKEQELQNLLQIYVKRLSDETARSVAYEARISLMGQQMQLMADEIHKLRPPTPGDAGQFPESKTGVGKTTKK